MTHFVLAFCVFVTADGADLPSQLQQALQSVAESQSKKYNCSISIAFKNADGETGAAAGEADPVTHRKAVTSDPYVWGSITKMFTGASIMKLVSEGAFKLDDRVAPLVNAYIAKMPTKKFDNLEDLWGHNVANVTVRQLLAMQTGIPDFDTATPSRTGESTDPLRAQLYAKPATLYSPTDLLSVDWVDGHWKDCESRHGTAFCYSSTNFIILGMLLASHAGDYNWQEFDQSSYLPASLRSEIKFAKQGSPKDFHAAHGIDRTSYNMPAGQTNDHDNIDVDGVFAGWTASNLVAGTPAVASLAWEIYGPPSSIAPKEYIDQMIPNSHSIYGLGTFNLGFFTGHMKDFLHQSLWRGYGHLGATYGYQSVAGYFPGVKFALSIATGMESDSQIQAVDAFCQAFNAAAGLLLGRTYTCSMSSASSYFPSCQCSLREEEDVLLV